MIMDWGLTRKILVKSETEKEKLNSGFRLKLIKEDCLRLRWRIYWLWIENSVGLIVEFEVLMGLGSEYILSWS